MNTERRLANTEKALLALWTLIEDNMPPDIQKAIGKSMEDYFIANKSLGAKFIPSGYDYAKEDLK